jgi:hypothetical protein
VGGSGVLNETENVVFAPATLEGTCRIASAGRRIFAGKCEIVDFHTFRSEILAIRPRSFLPIFPVCPHSGGCGGAKDITIGSGAVFPLANPQPANLQHRGEIGRFGLWRCGLELREFRPEKCEIYTFTLFFAKKAGLDLGIEREARGEPSFPQDA